MTKVILTVLILACGMTPSDARALQRSFVSHSINTLSAGELSCRLDEPAAFPKQHFIIDDLTSPAVGHVR